MKTFNNTKRLLLAMALLLAPSAFAADKASLVLLDPVTVAGTQLKAGEYTLQWEGTGANVELNFLRGKSVVAKTTAHEVDTDRSSPRTTFVTNRDNDGSQSLTQIQVQGKKYALKIGAERSQTETASSNK